MLFSAAIRRKEILFYREFALFELLKGTIGK